jgi:hypothetical protein
VRGRGMLSALQESLERILCLLELSLIYQFLCGL